MPRLPEKPVIVMDNASYHSAQLDKVPTSASRKSVVQKWLTKQNIPWDLKMTKCELYALINSTRITERGTSLIQLLKNMVSLFCVCHPIIVNLTP